MVMEQYKDRDWLYNKHITNRLTMSQISNRYGYGVATVYNWLKKFNIKTRTKACFKKGHIPWSKGTKGLWHHTKETKKKIGDAERGEKHYNWKGGKKISRGYVFILRPKHPYTNSQGYVQEHKLVAEKALGRSLKKDEVVHHINGNRADNRNENLLICNRKYHSWLEGKMANLYKKEHFGG